MREYRADLHIHTVLSPCGDLTMSPVNIVNEVVKKGIEIIGITDHNSTRHCRMIGRMAAAHGILTLMGAEVTTREEVHCLVFFEKTDTLDLLQRFLDENLPDVKNIPDFFGEQVEVDEDENIIYTENRLLTNATRLSIDELETFVHMNDGIFIPAHIDRQKNGIYGQLGLLPENLKADALEISWRTTYPAFSAIHNEIASYSIITSSDAHFPQHIARASTAFYIEEPSFAEIKMALAGMNGRRIQL